MSTNHRPQLESKRGKVIKIKDSIKHARALPQQKSLKYRQDIASTISGYGSDSDSEDEDEGDEISTPPLKKIKIDNTTVAKEESITSKEMETKEDNESESEESDSDSDSDDETALLLQEIEKIRQDKLANDKDQNESKLVAIQTGSTTKKKSWRLTTAFNNNKSKQAKEEKKYSTDSLESEYHQKLMSKYIR